MARLALLVALLGAGLGGWLVGERSALHGQVASLEQAQQAAEARLLQAERTLAALGSAPAEPALVAAAPAPQAPAAATDGAPATAARPGLSAAPRSATPAPALEERLARLEQDLAKARADRAPPPQAYNSRFLGSVDQAEKALNLDSTQKAGLERAIEDTSRELAQLASLRGEDGKTLKELQDALRTPLQQGVSGEEAQARFHENMAALSRFRQGKVPGTAETFAEAERRIRREGRTRARSYLNPEQAKQWDGSITDPLFRGPGGMEAGTSVVFASGMGVESGPIQVQVGR